MSASTFVATSASDQTLTEQSRGDAEHVAADDLSDEWRLGTIGELREDVSETG